MTKIPPQKPPVPPVPPRPQKPEGEKGVAKKGAPIGKQGGELRPPELDARGIAVRLAALAHEAKERELSFDEIIEKVMKETGIKVPQAAMEEANRKLQEEIEEVLDQIKSNKELMEEEEAWQTFAELLESKLSLKQVNEFFGMIRESIKEA